MVDISQDKILSVEQLGEIVRQQRKFQHVTQQQLAGLQNTGVRFISDVENGKPTVELGKVIKLLDSLGLEIHILPRQWPVRGES